MGDWRGGKNGETLILPVPDGTVVKSKDGKVLADLVSEGAEYTSRPAASAAWATPRCPRRSAAPPASRCSASKANPATSSWN